MMNQQVIIACAKGGTSIEDLAEKYPDQIIKVVVFLLKCVKVLCFCMDRCNLLGSSWSSWPFVTHLPHSFMGFGDDNMSPMFTGANKYQQGNHWCRGREGCEGPSAKEGSFEGWRGASEETVQIIHWDGLHSCWSNSTHLNAVLKKYITKVYSLYHHV